MKKTNTNKGLKKLIPAAGMLMLSAAMLGTSTFAWFTMNKEVSVTGMEVKTHVGSNLLISEDTLASVAKKAENTFVTDIEIPLHEILEPVSTVNGTSFFYTLDAKADGSKLTATSTEPYIAYAANGGTATDTNTYLNKFSEDYKLTKTTAASIYDDREGAVGYVDYVFQLKATNVEDAAQAIQITDMELTYGGNDDTDNAFRAAVFVEDITSSAPAGTVGTLKGIYKPAAGAYFDDTAVTSTTEKAAVTSLVTTTAVPIGTVGVGDINYYKVVVRLYIEGEDTTCNTSTFKALTDEWALDLTLELGGTGVTSIEMLPVRS